jgi:PAS domain S-box-containing protein
VQQIPQDTGGDLEVGTFDYDLVSGRITWSEALYRIYGFAPFSIEPSYEQIVALTLDEDRQRGDAGFQQAVESGHAEVTYRIRTAEGIRRLTAWMHVVRNERGEPFRMVGVVVDITRREEIDRARRRSESRYRSLVTATSQVVATSLQPERKVTDVVGSFEALTGRPTSVLFDGSWQQYVHPDDLGPLQAARASDVDAEFPFETEVRFQHLDGRWLHLHLRSVPVHHDPSIRENVVAITDRTAVRQAEADLVRLEAQLQHAQRLEAIGRLAGGIAHDFNNLLTVISGQAERLAPRLAEDPTSARQLEVIQHAAMRAAALTGQLLAFSRRQVLQPKLLSLNDVIGDVERMLGRVIGADVHVVTDLAGDLGATMADPGQVEQVIMNLAVNARDAMPRGGTLTLRTRNVIEPGDIAAAGLNGGPYVALAVEDTGHGMDDETLAHVFEPFFTTKERGRGTGLGLPTVYGIVTQSGGDVRIKTAVGSGTTVTVYLPRVEAARIRESIAATFVPEPTPTGRETVLVVEDEPLVRDLACDFIADAGYAVIEAETATEAADVFTGAVIDAVVSDVGLPDITGTELVATLRERTPGLAVVLMSGYTGEDPVVATEFDALTTFVQKPFTKATLLRALREVLDNRRVRLTIDG